MFEIFCCVVRNSCTGNVTDLLPSVFVVSVDTVAQTQSVSFPNVCCCVLLLPKGLKPGLLADKQDSDLKFQ